MNQLRWLCVGIIFSLLIGCHSDGTANLSQSIEKKSILVVWTTDLSEKQRIESQLLLEKSMQTHGLAYQVRESASDIQNIQSEMEENLQKNSYSLIVAMGDELRETWHSLAKTHPELHFVWVGKKNESILPKLDNLQLHTFDPKEQLKAYKQKIFNINENIIWITDRDHPITVPQRKADESAAVKPPVIEVFEIANPSQGIEPNLPVTSPSDLQKLLDTTRPKVIVINIKMDDYFWADIKNYPARVVDLTKMDSSVVMINWKESLRILTDDLIQDKNWDPGLHFLPSHLINFDITFNSSN
jgi:hypothetical protein